MTLSDALRVLVPVILVVGCGDSDRNDPTDVEFGDTALVVVVNPVVAEANQSELPTPGVVRRGIEVTSDDGQTAITGSDGIAVLGSLTAGTRTIALQGDDLDASFSIALGAGELVEAAIAADSTSATIMLELDYASDQVTTITADMSNADVNAALAVSDSVVFINGGRYVGDLDFSGSGVSLFAAGATGGEVTLDGDVTLSGSNSRIRGTRITGNLIGPASGLGVSFSTVDGMVDIQGSDPTLLVNDLCGTVSISGSNGRVLDTGCF